MLVLWSAESEESSTLSTTGNRALQMRAASELVEGYDGPSYRPSLHCVEAFVDFIQADSGRNHFIEHEATIQVHVD